MYIVWMYFFVVHTMDELKLTGNCLLGSRPLLCFDSVRVWGCEVIFCVILIGMLCTCRHFLNCLNLVWLGSSSLKYEEVVYCSFLMMISLWFRFSALPSIIPRASLSLTMCSTLLFLTGGFGLETTRYFCLLTVQTHPVRECPFPPSFFDVVTSAWQVVDGGASLTEIGRCAVNLVASHRFCIDLVVVQTFTPVQKAVILY